MKVTHMMLPLPKRRQIIPDKYISMSKPNKLILLAACLIIASITVLFGNGLKYNIWAFILKVSGLSIFVYALYIQARNKKIE